MQTIKLNLIPQGVNPTCYSSQFDVGRVIRVLLFEGVTPYTLSNAESVSLAVRKPDNTLVTTSVVNTEAEYVDIVTTEQMTAVTGVNICELKITNGSKVIGSLNFNMQVELDPTANGIPSGSALDNLQEQVNACVEVALEELYDGSSVSFDSEPQADHDAPYTVTSAGIKTALDTKANASDLNNYYNKTQIDNAFAGLTASNIGYDNSNTGLTADDTQEAIDEVLSKVPANASSLSYSNTQSGLEADNVQNAIDEAVADIPQNASELSYSNTQSGLTADDVQEAIDELASQSTDVSFTSNQNDGNKIGELTIDGVTTDLYTGELSTVGALDDLSDVDTTGKVKDSSIVWNSDNLYWQAKKLTEEVTQAEYDQLKLDGDLVEGVHYVITDGQNVTCNLGDLNDVDTTGASTGDILVKGASGYEFETPFGSWQGAGDFAISNNTTSFTLTQDMTDIKEIYFGLYLNVGTIGTRIRKSLIIPVYELKNVGVFFDEMITTNDRLYFEADYTDSTHLAISSASIPSGYTFGVKVYVR